MLVLTLTLILSALTTSCLAAPANHAEKRQGDKTFTVTCIGPRCTSYPSTTLKTPTTIPSIPGGPPNKPTTTPKTTTAKTTTAPTTKKSTTTSEYTPPPQNPPTKTTKTTKQPTKTQSEETGPSSTRCPVPLYYQCGGFYNGEVWTGCTKCVSGATCVWQNDWYYQCVAVE